MCKREIAVDGKEGYGDGVLPLDVGTDHLVGDRFELPVIVGPEDADARKADHGERADRHPREGVEPARAEGLATEERRDDRGRREHDPARVRNAPSARSWPSRARRASSYASSYAGAAPAFRRAISSPGSCSDAGGSSAIDMMVMQGPEGDRPVPGSPATRIPTSRTEMWRTRGADPGRAVVLRLAPG